MLKIKEYVKAESLEQAYELNQKKTNCVIGGMLWLKMVTRNVQKAIDLSGLGLDQIEENDIFYLHILDKTLAYKVYNIETVEPSNVESLAIQQGRDLATLVTCTPYGINSHRLLIHAMRVPYKGETKDAKEALKENLWQWLLKQKTLLVSVALLLLLLIYFIIQRIKARREKKHREMERRARRQRQIREKGGK